MQNGTGTQNPSQEFKVPLRKLLFKIRRFTQKVILLERPQDWRHLRLTGGQEGEAEFVLKYNFPKCL